MLEWTRMNRTLATFASEVNADPILDSRWEDVWMFRIRILEIKHPHILLDIPPGSCRRTLGFLSRTTLLGLLALLGSSGRTLILTLLLTGSGWGDDRLGWWSTRGAP